MSNKGKDKRIKVRGSWFGVNPVTKMTPTLVERKRKASKKHKKNWSVEND